MKVMSSSGLYIPCTMPHPESTAYVKWPHSFKQVTAVQKSHVIMWYAVGPHSRFTGMFLGPQYTLYMIFDLLKVKKGAVLPTTLDLNPEAEDLSPEPES